MLCWALLRYDMLRYVVLCYVMVQGHIDLCYSMSQVQHVRGVTACYRYVFVFVFEVAWQLLCVCYTHVSPMPDRMVAVMSCKVLQDVTAKSKYARSQCYVM
jgi:hypothetical protein